MNEWTIKKPSIFWVIFHYFQTGKETNIYKNKHTNTQTHKHELNYFLSPKNELLLLFSQRLANQQPTTFDPPLLLEFSSVHVCCLCLFVCMCVGVCLCLFCFILNIRKYLTTGCYLFEDWNVFSLFVFLCLFSMCFFFSYLTTNQQYLRLLSFWSHWNVFSFFDIIYPNSIFLRTIK
jgi:hypothetical protein